MSDKEFSNDFIQTFDQLSVKYDNILILGDLNYNMLLDNSKSTPLNNVCDIFDFSNLIKKATCFTKNALPTLIDVILTNKPNKCQNATNINCGLSDYHNLISVQLKGEIPKLKKDYVTYRSFKNFDHQKFLQELQSEQLDVITEHSNVETAYLNFETTFIKVVDKNIPLKKRRYITHPAPFMNKQCIKVENVCSNFKYMYKGVPQGSILRPVLFKIFINDIFYAVNNSTIYNYADDNTLSYADYDIKNVIQNLESDSLKMLDWFDYNLMKANPEKFQALAIGKKSFDHKIVFELKGNRIECENDVKLLGVTIDYELKFDKHISDICKKKKASRQLNVLKRIGKYLNKLGRLTIYYSFILINLNYCPITWHFCSEKNTLKMEKIQERALRFVYNNYTINYEELLHLSKLPSLKVRRLRSIALETFKIINKNCPSYLYDLINIKKHQYSFRYSNTTELPQVRTTY